MRIFLDTRTPTITVGLQKESREDWKFFSRRVRQPGQILLFLQSIVGRGGFALSHHDRVVVVQGPGMFSFVRAGVVIAQTLNYVCGVQVVGLEAEDEISPVSFVELQRAEKSRPTKILQPHYGREPSITIKK